MTQEQLENLLADMSLEEKVLQLYQIPGQNYMTNAAVTGVVDDNALPESVLYQVGSTLGIWGAEDLIRIQKDYMEHQPHHIPLMFMLDVIHGHKTVFPCPIAQGATFDPAIVEKGAEVASREAAADGVHVVFSPMADLSRDARWGRCMESTGEDPYLNSQMTAAMVRGYQGEDPAMIRNADRTAACVKHFAAYSAATAGRDYREADISEYSLRDQYLKAYKSGIDAGAAMVMTSFNPIDGIPASGNRWLMQDILRGEMGFDGVLISDWAAVMELVVHGVAADHTEAAGQAMKAGVDIDMCGDCYPEGLPKLLEDGRLTMEQIDEAVLRVLKLKNDLGLFEDPFHGASAERASQLLLCDEHRSDARKAAAQSLVLLQNEKEALPIRVEKNHSRIAFIGPYAYDADLRSSWSVSGDGKDCISIRQAAEEAFAGTGCDLAFAKGSMMLPDHSDLQHSFYHEDDWWDRQTTLLDEAADVMDWADTVVLCLGEDIQQSGESTSRTQLTIPESQQELLNLAVKRCGRGPESAAATAWFTNPGVKPKTLISLVFGGRPLELAEVSEVSDAVLVCWLPGTEGGHAILDVLTGKVSPQGKLPMSFPRSVGQEPLYYNVYGTGRPKPAEGNSMFTTRYLDCENDALYPFGYGLTYSEFEISEVKLDHEILNRPGTQASLAGVQSGTQASADETSVDHITATVTVTNCGSVEATETLQLYIQDLQGSRVRPVRELKGFRKVSLKPGESAEVAFTITEDMLRFWTAQQEMASEPGAFKVMIGFDSRVSEGVLFNLK